MHKQEQTWVYVSIVFSKNFLTHEAIHFYPRYIHEAFLYWSVFNAPYFMWWQRLLHSTHRNRESSSVWSCETHRIWTCFWIQYLWRTGGPSRILSMCMSLMLVFAQKEKGLLWDGHVITNASQHLLPLSLSMLRSAMRCIETHSTVFSIA